MFRLLRKFRKDVSGLAYLEFALSLPFLLLLFAGSIDVTRMVLLHQKVDKAVFTIGDLATQLRAETGVCDTIRNWENTVVRDMILPFQYDNTNFSFIVSSVLGTTANWDASRRRDMIEWRYARGSASSIIGVFSSPYEQQATLPSTIRGLQQDERVIVTEMRYRFVPLLPRLSGLSTRNFQKVSYFRSRISTGREGRGSGVLSRC